MQKTYHGSTRTAGIDGKDHSEYISHHAIYETQPKLCEVLPMAGNVVYPHDRPPREVRGLHKREGQPDFAPEARLRNGQGPASRGNREGQPS